MSSESACTSMLRSSICSPAESEALWALSSGATTPSKAGRASSSWSGMRQHFVAERRTSPRDPPQYRAAIDTVTVSGARAEFAAMDIS